MKGRPADPARARRRTGNREKPGQARKAKVVALPSPTEVVEVPSFAPPEDLPEAAVPIWRQAVGELEPRGLRPADLESIRQMCVAAAFAREAEALIAKYGMVVKGANGRPSPNPMLRQYRDMTVLYTRLAEQFGLTLASRLRLGLMTLAGETMLGALNRDLNEG